LLRQFSARKYGGGPKEIWGQSRSSSLCPPPVNRVRRFNRGILPPRGLELLVDQSLVFLDLRGDNEQIVELFRRVGMHRTNSCG
jgi:hypothetical protein